MWCFDLELLAWEWTCAIGLEDYAEMFLDSIKQNIPVWEKDTYHKNYYFAILTHMWRYRGGGRRVWEKIVWRCPLGYSVSVGNTFAHQITKCRYESSTPKFLAYLVCHCKWKWWRYKWTWLYYSRNAWCYMGFLCRDAMEAKWLPMQCNVKWLS